MAQAQETLDSLSLVRGPQHLFSFAVRLVSERPARFAPYPTSCERVSTVFFLHCDRANLLLQSVVTDVTSTATSARPPAVNVVGIVTIVANCVPVFSPSSLSSCLRQHAEVWISHHHADHCAGLPTLLARRLKPGLKVIAPPRPGAT